MRLRLESKKRGSFLCVLCISKLVLNCDFLSAAAPPAVGLGGGKTTAATAALGGGEKVSAEREGASGGGGGGGGGGLGPRWPKGLWDNSEGK